MGNCSTLCSGLESEEVKDPQKKKIDANAMQEAQMANRQAELYGNQVVSQGLAQSKNDQSGLANNNTPAGKDQQNVRIQKDPIQLESGALYQGEWMNGVRDGFGK